MLEPPSADHQGNVWIPSFTPTPFIISERDEGVHRFVPKQMTAMTTYPLIADAVVHDRDGFWLMQSRVGLMYYRPCDELLVSALHGETKQWLFSYTIFPRNTADGTGVWVADGKRIWWAWMEADKMRLEVLAELGSNINCMYEQTDGFLLAGTDEGVVKINTRDGSKETVLRDTGHVYDITSTTDGTIYLLSSHMGFAVGNPDGTALTLAPTDRYDKMATAGTCCLWLSSADGTVAKYDTRTHTLEPNPVASARKGNVVKRLGVDACGHVWILTSLYVKEYNPANDSFRMFWYHDSNIAADYFQDLKVDGRSVCFAGAGGIYLAASAEALDRESAEAHAAVTDVSIDSTVIYLGYGTSELTVPAQAKHVVVRLTSFSPLDADKVTFAYRLTPSNTQWINLPMGTNEIHLSNLTKGTYQLQVKATNQYGKWSQEQTVLTIDRVPAWWETWWAYLLYILTCATLIVLAVRYYIARQNRRHELMMEQQLTDMKFRFFTNMSHELRTPLTLIITPLTSIVRNMEEERQRMKNDEQCANTDDDLRGKLSDILRHANSLLEMINNLLSFRKMEMGEMKLNLRYGDLCEFLAAACQSFMPIYEKKGITLTFTPGAPHLGCYFDKSLLHHIMFNLLSNAHKFTPSGGKVTVGANRADTDMIEISVADTGIGIAKEELGRIFERFYQVPSTTAGTDALTTGSGIGLNMVSEMAALHGGSVSVSSPGIGMGSTFTVLLPKTPSTRQGLFQSETAEQDTHDGGDFTVLLVEDNEVNREIATYILEDKGCEVVPAVDGQAAVDTFLAQPAGHFGLIFMDIRMPFLDGYGATRAIRASDHPDAKTVPIVAMTANAFDEDARKAYDSGMNGYLTKPVEPQNIYQMVRRFWPGSEETTP